MGDKKTIVVLGATGGQGGGLARAILRDRAGDFAVRALTRDINGAKAKELAKMGADLVAGDVDSIDSLKKAFAGAYGAYCVTFFWAHFTPEKEIAEAQAMAVAAKSAGLQHVIWSTLEDTRKWVPLGDDRMPTLKGRYKVPHFDAKGESNHYFTDLGIPTTFLLTSMYWDNFLYPGTAPQKGPDGKLAVTFPMGDKKLPGIAVEDIGKCAYGIFKQGKQFIDKTVGISGEQLTCAQMASTFTEVLGREIRYDSVSPDAFRAFGFPGADDLGNMFQFKRDFAEYFCGARNPAVARSLNPELQNFKTWLTQHKSEIPLGSAGSS